jgi:tRNA G10  N-methylase Trm11
MEAIKTQDLILAATAWPTNAHMVQDLHRIDYIKQTDLVLDPTYGKGVWWKLWQPDNLIIRSNLTDSNFDFRNMEFEDNYFDVITYDPPYVATGGKATNSNIDTMRDGYGINEAPKTAGELQTLINDGLTEMYRVIKPSGLVLTKCQDYVTSGKLHAGTYWTMKHGLELGFTVYDRFEHLGKARAQPPRLRQLHARRNLSTLIVFQAPRSK